MKLEVLQALYQNKQDREMESDNYYRHMQSRKASLIIDSLRVMVRQRKIKELKIQKVTQIMNSRITENAFAAW